MLACKHCSTPNSLDSTFCKKCGTAVPADQKREATVQLDKLVEEGLTALNAGRTAEALAIADSAVATDPSHLGALHLKSAVHERRGEIADALESAERIVELNPDSELDRIKRNGLRSSLLNASTPVQPDRRIAFAAAAAAMVLVACVGVLAARKPAPPTVVASTVGSLDNPLIEAPVALPQPQVATQTPNTTPDSRGGINNPVTPMTNPGVLPPVDVNPPTTDPGVTRLPSPEGTITTPIDPGAPPERPQPQVPNKKPPTPQPDLDPSPQPLPRPAEASENPGEINITVTKGGTRRTGGSTLLPDTQTNGATAYARVGTERFGLGDYAGAAANLERAVAGGGNPVGLNLMLAQAYGRMGRNSEAANAYERSRAAADAAIASGKGDRERLQAQRDAAEAGLKTVRG